MSDFAKELSQKLQEKKKEADLRRGFCHLRDRHYATISGYRIKLATNGQVEYQDIHWLLDLSDLEKPVLCFLKAVTGYEAYYLTDLLHEKHGLEVKYREALADKNKDVSGLWSCDNPWPYRVAICCGTDGRWDHLSLDIEQLLDIVKECEKTWKIVKP